MMQYKKDQILKKVKEQKKEIPLPNKSKENAKANKMVNLCYCHGLENYRMELEEKVKEYYLINPRKKCYKIVTKLLHFCNKKVTSL